MRWTRILCEAPKYAEQMTGHVDRSATEALQFAYREENAQLVDQATDSSTPEAKIARDPEMAGIYLTVKTSEGERQILVRPPNGNPTGLTELFEHPQPREALLEIYDHTLAFLAERFPTDSVYRTSVENLTRTRRDIVSGNNENLAIEEKIGSGLVEEILVQAADEFLLAEQLAAEKVWEDLEEPPLPDQWAPHAYKNG